VGGVIVDQLGLAAAEGLGQEGRAGGVEVALLALGARLVAGVDHGTEHVKAALILFQPGDVHPVVGNQRAHGGGEAIERRRRVEALRGDARQAGQRVEQRQAGGQLRHDGSIVSVDCCSWLYRSHLAS
jgi:hypothetical protein